MAWLEPVRLTRFRLGGDASRIEWLPSEDLGQVDVPLICWTSGAPWREVNQWLLSRVDDDKDPATVSSDARCLHAYAQWLEKTQTNWLEFPERKRDRCLVRYRGSLAKAIDEGALATSTGSLLMRTVIRFYRWLRDENMIDPETPLWTEVSVVVKKLDRTGLERKVTANSTDLRISNNPVPGIRLEGGLRPVSDEMRKTILDYARDHASVELRLMLALGFFTGMRLGSLCDLKVGTVFNATKDSKWGPVSLLTIGPQANPAVMTKFGVTGTVIIPSPILEQLQDYCGSARRMHREKHAQGPDKDLVFLTRFGNPYYAQRGHDRSSAVNVELHRLKKIISKEVPHFEKFKFHQTRATFGTDVARIAMQRFDAASAIAIVQAFLLHKHETTTLKYIKFIEQESTKADLANEFSRLIASAIEPRTHYAEG